MGYADVKSAAVLVLPEPEDATLKEWKRLLERVFNTLRDDVLRNALDRVATATDYTITRHDRYIGVTDTSGARALSLVLSTKVEPGHRILIVDESGAANVNNITITRSGTEWINGANTYVINAAYGWVELTTDGNGKWFAID